MHPVRDIKRVALRPAGLSDADLLYRWVNSPDALANKLRTRGPIPREEHERWFRKHLEPEGGRIWIVERQGQALGQVRFEPDAGGHEIDVYIMPEHRRLGIASQALQAAFAAFGREHDGTVLIARVRPENEASRRLFESLGFTLREHEQDHQVFIRTLGKGRVV